MEQPSRIRSYMYYYCICSLQISEWVKEKYKTATDESYRDPTNLQAKLLKHQAFEAELKANNERLKGLNQVINGNIS